PCFRNFSRNSFNGIVDLPAVETDWEANILIVQARGRKKQGETLVSRQYKKYLWGAPSRAAKPKASLTLRAYIQLLVLAPSAPRSTTLRQGYPTLRRPDQVGALNLLH